jgi:predicted glycosyltransferase
MKIWIDLTNSPHINFFKPDVNNSMVMKHFQMGLDFMLIKCLIKRYIHIGYT